jgi:prolyl oligopeptidase
MLALLAAAALAATPSPAERPAAGIKYPEAARGDTVDDYFGTKVPDPYRWLEDGNSPETAAWVKAENALTEHYLAGIPERKAIRERLTRLWNYERFSEPLKKGKRYFYSRNSGLQPQAVWFVTEDPSRDGRVLLDPNAFSGDGTVAVAGLGFTDDGRYMAYALSDAGSDWLVWRVRDVETGRDLPDEVRWSKDSGASWRKDGSGFYYSRFDEPGPGQLLEASTQNQQVWFHRRGTPQAEDELVYRRPDEPEWYLQATVSDDGRWLVIQANRGTNPESALFVEDLTRPGSKPLPLVDRMDAAYEFVDNLGDTFLVLTNQGAPRQRLVAVALGQPDPKDFQVVIPEGKGRDVLQQVTRVGERLVALWARDVKSAVEIRDLDGRWLSDLALPGVGTVSGLSGRRGDPETSYLFTGFTTPPTAYRLDTATLAGKVFRRPKVDFDPSAYETRQVFYSSKDGTRIPMFVVHKKGLSLDGTHPTLLYGYGGFNISLLPAFRVGPLVWLEMGGVYAVANLRGGGEYGKDWYEAGRLRKKQNVFDDFIAAAQWLVAKGYTSPSRLAMNGGSNGGLLVGAVMTERPDLCAVALPQVPVTDMLRFHRFTLGWGWKSDYGSSETKDGFDVLIRYSPLHNLKAGVRYPATLVTTADHDDRVVPAHAFKFVAALQAAQGGDGPVLARIETRAGHGAGKPTRKIIDEQADLLAFTLKNLGMALPDAFGAPAPRGEATNGAK